jgi:hypothetical protein
MAFLWSFRNMPLIMLNSETRMKEREQRVVTETTAFNGENRDKFTAMKVPRQCSLVLLVKVG